MLCHKTTKRVRYGETDQMGYLYYGHYAQYYEIGRVELLRSIGLSYKLMEEKMRVMLPVVQLESKYIKPAFYDDLLTIETCLQEFPDKRIEFHVNIYNPNQELINKGLVRLMFVDMKTGKVCMVPEELASRLKPYFS